MSKVIKLTPEFIAEFCTHEGGRIICYIAEPFQLCPVQYGEHYYTSEAISVNPKIPPNIRLLLAEMEKVNIEELPREEE